MVDKFEQFLNIAIPWGIILGFAGIVYWKAKKPIDTFFRWIGGMISEKSHETKHEEIVTTLTFKD